MAYEKPLISVVIPNYNYGQFLGEAIESVLNQTYKNIQLVVIDNESTDNTIHKIKFNKKGQILDAPSNFFKTYMMDVMEIAINAAE